jgi:hypothetical protein
LRDLGHDGGPDEQDVTLLQTREQASRDHAFAHERTLTAAMAPLRNLVRTMKQNLRKLITNNQGSGHSHRMQYRRAIRVAEIKLQWAEQAQQKAQAQLASSDARLREAQKRRLRVLKLEKNNGALLDKLSEKVLADEAMMTSENEPKTPLAISQFVNTEVSTSEGIVAMNIKTAEGIEMVAAMGGGIAAAKKAAQDRARQSAQRQVKMATEFTKELKMLSDKDKCKEKALITAKFSAHKLKFKPGVFDCGWEGESEMAKQESFLKNEISYNNKELAQGFSASGRVKLLNSANNRTVAAIVSMLGATKRGKQVIMWQQEVFEKEQDFKRSKERAEEIRVATLTGDKAMLAKALETPSDRLGETSAAAVSATPMKSAAPTHKAAAEPVWKRAIDKLQQITGYKPSSDQSQPRAKAASAVQHKSSNSLAVVAASVDPAMEAMRQIPGSAEASESTSQQLPDSHDFNLNSDELGQFITDSISRANKHFSHSRRLQQAEAANSSVNSSVNGTATNITEPTPTPTHRVILSVKDARAALEQAHKELGQAGKAYANANKHAQHQLEVALEARAMSYNVQLLQRVLAIGASADDGAAAVRHLAPPFEFAAGDAVAMAALARRVRNEREKVRQQMTDRENILATSMPLQIKIQELTEQRNTATDRKDAMEFHRQLEDMIAAARETALRTEKAVARQRYKIESAKQAKYRQIDNSVLTAAVKKSRNHAENMKLKARESSEAIKEQFTLIYNIKHKVLKLKTEADKPVQKAEDLDASDDNSEEDINSQLLKHQRVHEAEAELAEAEKLFEKLKEWSREAVVGRTASAWVAAFSAEAYDLKQLVWSSKDASLKAFKLATDVAKTTARAVPGDIAEPREACTAAAITAKDAVFNAYVVAVAAGGRSWVKKLQQQDRDLEKMLRAAAEAAETARQAAQEELRTMQAELETRFKEEVAKAEVQRKANELARAKAKMEELRKVLCFYCAD